MTPRSGDITLPAGRVADLLEGLGPDVVPAALENVWPDWSDRSPRGWAGELPWRRWVELVRAEAGASAPDPARRGELAVLARMQGRDADAWRHLVDTAREPAIAAGLLPLFVPGVPPALVGSSGPLPDGVLLSPALPPVLDHAGRSGLRALAGSMLEHRAVLVGGARLSLRVAVEPDGLQVDLAHLEGPSVRVRVQPPLPGGIDAGPYHVDWERLPEDRRDAVEFLLGPAKEQRTHTLWVSFRRRRENWPAPRIESIAPLDRSRALLVASPRGDEPHLARFAEALGELFALPTALVSEPASGDAFLLEPIVIRIGEGWAGERKLATMIGLAEDFALRPRAR